MVWNEIEVDKKAAWQRHPQLGSVLELVFWWLDGRSLARACAVSAAWRAAGRCARAWRRLLLQRAPGSEQALRVLAHLYRGACPWREVYVASVASWREVARVAPPGPAPLAAAALNRDGSLLALAAEDCSFTIWQRGVEAWERAGEGSVAALGWRGVARAEWAPRAPLLLLAGAAPLAASRGAIAILAQRSEGAEGEEGAGGAWRVAARAGGSGGCWAGAGFVSLELTRLSAPHHAPHFATDVWLNAATQETDDEHAGVAARVLRIYNEAPAVISQVVCAEVPLDERAAREWAEAEAEVRTEDEQSSLDEEQGTSHTHARSDELTELVPGEAYYRATYERDVGRKGCAGPEREGAWVRLVLLACGGVLGAWALPAAGPPPLRVSAPLAARVAARRARRQREAEAAEAPPEPPAPEPPAAELRARCTAPAARLRLPGRVLGLTVHDSGLCVWACVAGGAVCASLPALRELRAVRLVTSPAAPAPQYYVQPSASGEYFGSPCGGWSGGARVVSAAPGAGALLEHTGPALALLLTPAPRAHRAPRDSRAAPLALVLTEDALHVWQCTAPRAPPPTLSEGGEDY